MSASYVNGMASGRYHANLRLLYDTKRHYPAADFDYVVFGSAVYARPAPLALPARPRGPRPKALTTT